MPGLSSKGERVVLLGLMTGRFISFHTTEPDDNGSSEVVGGGYSRIAQGDWDISGVDPSEAHNSDMITSPIATADWGTLTHFGVWTTLDGGDFLGAWPLEASHSIDLGGYVRATAGSLKIRSD